MTDFPISRRAMLGAIGAAGAALSLQQTARLRGERGLVLIDADLAHADRRVARSMAKGRRVETLKGDLVWQWRRGLDRRLADGGQAMAILRWDKAILLSGLLREAGLAARQARIGQAVFRIDIG
jgi:hypothetical protein